MRMLLMWPSGNPEMKVLLDEMTAAGHEVIYWVGEHEGERFAPAGCVFHDHYDAWDAKRAKALEGEVIPPVDTETIQSMHDIESLVLTMMNKRYDSAPVDERKHVYYTMLAYWTHVLEKYKPDYIVYSILPHSIYSNIVYELAQKRGIPTVCFEDTWFVRRTIAYKNFWTGSDELRAALSQLQDKDISEEDLSDELRSYWQKDAKPESRTEPSYMTFQRRKEEGFGLVKKRLAIAANAVKRGNVSHIVRSFVSRRFGENLKKEYARHSRQPEWHVPFVYAPLHFQPERTTSPQGGVYHDQLLVVETLSAALPAGWEIFVKEHPSQWWLRSKERYSSARYKGYYERLSQIPHVRIVPIETNSFDLTERSQAVAVVTGTVGWEALLRGKCPLVFGIPWWRDCPGVLRIDSVESCRKAFAAIKKGAAASDDNVLRFLKALDTIGVPGHIEPPLESKPQSELDENMRVFAKYITKELHK